MLPGLRSFCRLPPPQAAFYVPIRNSQWPKNYISPVVLPANLKELSEEERRQRVFQPVKAAPNAITSSVYFDYVTYKLENWLVRKGKRLVARRVIDATLAEIKRIQLEKYRQAKTDEERNEIELDPVKIVNVAFNNMIPTMITKRTKRGGATYTIPFQIPRSQGFFIARKWLFDFVFDRPKPKKDQMPIPLARELLAGYNLDGKTVKKKQEMHRTCEANKAYAHYRWN